jgi:molybdopterin-guanine dinucleotide biosynthesis protein A
MVILIGGESRRMARQRRCSLSAASLFYRHIASCLAGHFDDLMIVGTLSGVKDDVPGFRRVRIVEDALPQGRR